MCVIPDFYEKFIPSSYVRERLRRMGHVFSGWDVATIVWNSDVAPEEKTAAIKQIAEATDDELLRTQIYERVGYDADAIKAFAVNDGGFVYILYSLEFPQEEDLVGCFDSPELAIQEGCSLGYGFKVEKHQIVGVDTDRIKGRIICSPVLVADESKRIVEIDHYGRGVSEFTYNQCGSLVSYWSNELSIKRQIHIEAQGNQRFENRFVVIPDIFKVNDMVRVLLKDGFREGRVVETSLSHEDYVKRATEEGSLFDYVDVSIPVEYWDEDCKEWSIIHVNPLDLEIVDQSRNLLDELDKGIDDMENGRVTPHEESMKILAQRYNDYVSQNS